MAGLFADSSDEEPLVASGTVEDVQVQNVAGLFADSDSNDSESMPDTRPPPEDFHMHVGTFNMANTLPTAATARDIVALFSDGSSNEDMPPERQTFMSGHNSESPPITLDQAGQLFADSSEDEDEDAEGEDDLEGDSGQPNISENSSAASGPYTSMTFQNIPDNWLDGI